MQKRSSRKFEIVTNHVPITAAQLPPMSASKPQYMPQNQQNTPNASASFREPELPAFGISGLQEAVPQELPALDFAQEIAKSHGQSGVIRKPKSQTEKEIIKEQQIKTVSDHIARDNAMRERQRIEEEKEEEAPKSPIKVLEPNVDTKIEVDDKYRYERVYLPSQGILGYDYVEIRPLDAPELMLLHRVRASANETDLFDALGRCIRNFNIRDLCLGDFRFVFYWLKINSYTRNPFTVRFTSKYGNENKISLKMSDLQITPLAIEDDDLDYFIEKNFCIPTLHEAEQLNRLVSLMPNKTDEEKKAIDAFMYKATYAQYVQGGSFPEKLENLMKKYTPDDWVDIMRFANIIKNFGVVENIKVKDAKFDPDDALVYLKNGLEELSNIDMSAIQRDDLVALLENNKQEIQAEIDRITEELSNTGEAAATSETVTFSLSLDAFFPENLAG